uniref:Uncharacterized protein n=1 Tax=Heterosigma akashiwo TaxID=2829 RepID=A0A7S3YFF4_HETAK
MTRHQTITILFFSLFVLYTKRTVAQISDTKCLTVEDLNNEGCSVEQLSDEALIEGLRAADIMLEEGLDRKDLESVAYQHFSFEVEDAGGDELIQSEPEDKPFIQIFKEEMVWMVNEMKAQMKRDLAPLKLIWDSLIVILKPLFEGVLFVLSYLRVIAEDTFGTTVSKLKPWVEKKLAPLIGELKEKSIEIIANAKDTAKEKLASKFSDLKQKIGRMGGGSDAVLGGEEQQQQERRSAGGPAEHDSSNEL